MATSSLAILGFGIFYAAHRQMLSPAPGLISEKPQSSRPAPDPVSKKMEPAKIKTVESFQASLKAPVSRPKTTAKAVDVADAKQYPPPIDFDALEKQQGMAQAEAVDYLLVSPDNHVAPDKLPKKLYMPYGQPSEEYFIRNVSH